MQFTSLIQPLSAVLRQVSYLSFPGTASPSFLIYKYRAFELTIVVSLQSIDILRTLYENQLPVRFGVMLYSTLLIKTIEDNGGQIPSSDSQVKEDISTMVFIVPCSYYVLF